MKKYSIIVLANQMPTGLAAADESFESKIISTSHLIELIQKYKDAPSKVIIINEKSLNEEVERVIVESNFKVLKTTRHTKGALATAALSLDLVNETDPIVIVPSNAKVEFDLAKFLSEMKHGDHAAGIVTLRSDNPNMSFVRSYQNVIVEIAEKRIIGKEATAGIFYFKDRSSLVEAIGWALVNQVTTNGEYYIAPALNYFLTQRLPIGRYRIGDEDYERIEY